MNIRLITSILSLLISGSCLAQNNTLDFYLSQAAKNSPLLKDYQNQVLSNQLDSQRILAGYKPQVIGSSFNSYAPIIGGFGYDQAITNGGNFTTVVGVNKTFVSRKNLETQFNAINLQSQSVLNTSKITEQDLKKTIVAQYITAYGDVQQLKYTKEVYELLQKEEVILKRLARENVYRQTDYLTFLVSAKQEALLYKQVQIQFKNDFATLNYLSGITDTSTVWLDDPKLSLDKLPDLTNSVFFKQFELDSLKLSNNRTLIDFSYKPKANIFADAGYSSSFTYQAYKNFGTSFGFSVTVPIYDGHQKKLQYTKLNIAERTRGYYKTFFLSQYHQQIAQLTQQLLATEQLIGEINEQVKYSESLIAANEKLLETGDAKIADYIIAFSNYLNSKNLLIQNSITRMQIINQINYWNR